MDAWLVGLGASRGGLEALQPILTSLSDDLPAAVVIVQHRSPDGGPALARLLQRSTSLPVIEPEDQEPIARGQIYLAPSDYHLLVEYDAFALSVEAPVSHARPSIDVLFESMARFHGRRAIAVVLSSSTPDGAAGAGDVARAGGRVVVQRPSTAESATSIFAALACCKASTVAAPADIGPLLAAWCAERPPAPFPIGGRPCR